MSSSIPILDSHIHLYPSSEASTLAWWTPTNPISSQRSLSEYSAATSLPPALEGFIFLETDRTHDLALGIQDGSGWKSPLQEVAWLRRIATGDPRPGEGHTAAQKGLCKAIVPWAPLPSGVEAMERYVERVKEEAGEAWGLVRGFRYLVQDKPRGTMLTEDFVEGLKWLGRKGFAFDVGVDAHREPWQLEECVQMVERAHRGVPEAEKVVFVINHICKADLTLAAIGQDLTGNAAFEVWSEAIYRLSDSAKTYIKLSGCFSEMPSSLKTQSADAIFRGLYPWLAVVLATFGPFRTMFGSDWPVCAIGIDQGSGGEEDLETGGAWKKWRAVVQRMCDMASLELEEQIMIWSGTAIEAYGIKELM